VLLDIAMPRLNGLQACAAIRNLPGYADVPIVMLTAYDDERFRVAAKRVGATTFITKPFRPSLLLMLLGEYLDYPESTKISGVALPTGPGTVLVNT
jgi:CheY-like chemotaxis protein